jgi:hypothetical protein
MNKELSETTLIRLQTELENAIGFRDHYATLNEIIQYNVWDMEIERILEDMAQIGES